MATKFLSPAQLADEWGVNVRTVTRWIKAGELRGYKLGPHTRRVAETDAADFLAKRATDAAEGIGTLNGHKPYPNPSIEAASEASPPEMAACE
jgi:excisionase family DNA binding protein